MAGLFGFLDTSKPGPGVSKNAPQKKRFFLFWELYGRKIWKLAIANLLYVLVSLPVVTIGWAQAGLTFVTRNYVREKHVFLPSDFFDTIKKNQKQAFIIGIEELLIGAILGFDLVYAWNALMVGETMSLGAMLFFAVSLFLAVLFLQVRYYLYLQLITFKFSIKQIWKNSVLFSIIGFKQNFIISVSLLLLYAVLLLIFLAFDVLSVAALLAIYVFLLPAFRSFLIQFNAFPLVQKHIIDPYYQAHPDEDIEKRRDLNLPENSQPQSEDDVVFEDCGRQEKQTIPKQYDKDELRKGKRLSGVNNAADDDDDDTI